MVKGANKIAAVYLIAGVSWILFSDTILFNAPIFLQSIKGIAYVCVTALALWYFLRQIERKNRLIMRDLISGVEDLRIKDNHLQQEKALLRTVIDNLPDNIFVKDTNGKIVIANKALVRFVGKTHESEMIGRYASDFFPEYVSSLAAEKEGELVSGKAEFSEHEFLLRDSAGQVQRMLSTKVPVLDHHGKVVNIVGLSRDITAVFNKSKSDALVLDIINALGASTNLNTALVATLELIGNHFGFKFAEAWLTASSHEEVVISATWSRESDSKFHHGHQQIYASGQGLPGLTFSTREIQFWSNILEHPDFLRRERSVAENLKTAIGIPVVLEDKVIAVFTFLSEDEFYDFTHVKMVLVQVSAQIALHLERKKHESELEASNAQINNILESISDGFFALEEDWTVTYWNTEAEKLLQMPRLDIIGRKLTDLYPADMATHSSSYSNYEMVMRDKKPVVFEEYYEPLGIWLEINVYPTQSGISVFLRDNTESHRLRSELDKRIDELGASNAELEQFAYIASHDLQEPLRMITGFLTQLQRKYDGELDEKAQQYIHFAVDGAVRMRKIILDLLEYSRVGKVEVRFEPIDTNELIDGILQMNKTLFEEEQVSFKRGDLPNTFGGKTAIQQVFHNLITNAVRYRKAGVAPVITVSGKEDADYCTFAVTDNGIGIKSDFYDKVFVLFQRLHNRDEYSGTGIGLAICKKIIENHGGRIWIDSEEGVGTTFYFTIKK